MAKKVWKPSSRRNSKVMHLGPWLALGWVTIQGFDVDAVAANTVKSPHKKIFLDKSTAGNAQCVMASRLFSVGRMCVETRRYSYLDLGLPAQLTDSTMEVRFIQGCKVWEMCAQRPCKFSMRSVQVGIRAVTKA